MFHKILVAINDTESGQQVFKETLSLATATNAELFLLHIISPVEDGELNLFSLQTDSIYGSFHTHGVEYYVREWEALKKHGIEFLTFPDFLKKSGI